jgi:hypothetical protein
MGCEAMGVALKDPPDRVENNTDMERKMHYKKTDAKDRLS